MMLTERNPYAMSNNSLPKNEKMDAEIEEMAKKIQVANSKKIITQPATCLTLIPKQSTPFPIAPDKELAPDYSSLQGQFGWIEIGKTTIPYIFRSGEKYVAERMADQKLFQQFLGLFSNEIVRFLNLDKLNATKAEAMLLNEININHSDRCYGRSNFRENDNIIALHDVIEMFDFLNFSYRKLTVKDQRSETRCGFIRIGSENCVPYVSTKNGKHVPLFYFEGECEYLEERASEMSSWDLAYLKFACEIQGIRRALTEAHTIKVVPLELVKKFFLPDTKFEEFWLVNTANHLLKNAGRVSNLKTGGEAQRKVQSTGMYVPPKAQLPQNSVSTVNQQILSFMGTKYNNGSSGFQNQFINGLREQTNALPEPVSNSSRPAMTNISPNNNRGYCKIPEVNYQGGNTYFLTPNQVEKMILQGCINMEPFNSTTQLVSLEELAQCLFFVPIETILNAVVAMGLTVYIPNRSQMSVLQSFGLYTTKGLIKVKDLVDNLFQLKYILNPS